uniref:sensor domain-containing protein n=1 Tax=Kitasatospora sp. MBT63 TaxID=1444768 RepID=UPI0011EA63F0
PGPAAAPAPGPGPATPSAPPQQGPARRSSPPPGPGARRGVRVLRQLRHWRLLLAAVLPCLVLAGIGWWAWPQQPTGLPPHIAEGTVQAGLLDPDGVSRLAGTTLVAGPRSNRPHAPLTVAPSECAAAAGPTTQSVYGQAWKAYLSATYQDAGGSGAYTVNQVLGVFPDTDKAAAAFQALTDGLAKCPSATVTGQADRSSKWAYTARPATEVAVAWTAAQDGSAGWACYHQARLKGTNLVQASVCQAGDGESTSWKVADELTKKVTG